MRKLSVALSLITVLMLSTSADAQGKRDVMGTVTAIEERRIEVKSVEGEMVELKRVIAERPHIVAHWDVPQRIPAESANQNMMF